jgi:PKD repeat protein
MLKSVRWLIFAVVMGLVGSCYEEQEIPIVIDFEYTITDGSYTVPVEMTIANSTTGADFYAWTFDGASPGTSDDKQPGVIRYERAGTYIIALEAWNDTQRERKEITIVLDSAVTVGFDVDILVNDFSPVTVALTDHTRGATSYAWTFEGGVPETSAEAKPGPVVFETPGEHDITLTVFNGREYFTETKTVVVKDALLPDFEIVPFFEDTDYEAPLYASLANKTVSGLRYQWTATGGDIDAATATETEIYFPGPGTYTVTLKVENDKEVKSVQREIVVKPNTNLYIMDSVVLGVTSSHATIGCFYAPRLRSVVKRAEVTAENAPLIDLVFYGINASFGYCRFLSPDSASRYTFPAIPQASHTYIVNVLSAKGITFTPQQFDAMTTDADLVGIDIRGKDTAGLYFMGNNAPMVVLFETADGRKGAIKVREFVAAGAQSYIVADIKIQKLKS